MKVVGIGLNKTGTTTLGVCLRYWGLNHISCSQEAFELWKNNEYDQLLTWVQKYDSFDDWPWPLIFPHIDSRFPGTKFVLTRRKDAQTWYRSLCKHACRTGPTVFRKHVYGHEMPHNHMNAHIEIYERHLDTVREYFRGRDNDFLEVCWEENHGWDELSSFLGLVRPTMPFPHANKAPTLLSRLRRISGLDGFYANRGT